MCEKNACAQQSEKYCHYLNHRTYPYAKISLRFGSRVTRFQCRTASGTDFSNFRNGHIERVRFDGRQSQGGGGSSAQCKPVSDVLHCLQWRASTAPSNLCAHSGNPAFRSPSNISVEFVWPPRAIHADIVKSGSTSSNCAAASRASASRPRWAKADARQQ